MELIPVVTNVIGADTVQTVNARELHVFLEVGKVFGAWVKDRIEQFGFVENQDFVVVSEIGKNPLGGRPAIEYHLSIDMAKELSMVERNDKGRQARRYFIECERRVKAIVPALPDFSNPVLAARAWADAEEKRRIAEGENKLLAAQVEDSRPAVEFTEAVTRAENALSIGDFSKLIRMGRNKLFALLREEGILQIESRNVPYQQYIDAGYFRVIEEHKIIGRTQVVLPVTLITGKGQVWLCKRLGIGGQVQASKTGPSLVRKPVKSERFDDFDYDAEWAV